MPAPALSIARICKQLVHEFLERVAGLIPEERVHLLDRRRHTGQINIYATHQNSLVRFRSRSQALLLQLRKDECINRVLHPRAVSYGRRLLFYGLLERPAPLRRLRRRGKPQDPLFNARQVGFRERFAKRHLRLDLSPENTDKHALIRMPFHDRSAVFVASGDYGLGARNGKAAGLRLVGMAGAAVLLKNGKRVIGCGGGK